MARTKAEPKHNPEKFRRHLNQAMFHLGLAQREAKLIPGHESGLMMIGLNTAHDHLGDCLVFSRNRDIPIGQDSYDPEQEN